MVAKLGTFPPPFGNMLSLASSCSNIAQTTPTQMGDGSTRLRLPGGSPHVKMRYPANDVKKYVDAIENSVSTQDTHGTFWSRINAFHAMSAPMNEWVIDLSVKYLLRVLPSDAMSRCVSGSLVLMTPASIILFTS